MIAMDTATTAPATLDLGVAGMTCASCVSRVERALKKVPGVSDAVVNLATESARVTLRLGAGGGADPPCRAQCRLRAALRRGARAGRPLGLGRLRAGGDRLLLSLPLVLPMVGEPVGQHWMLPAWLQFLLATPVQFVLGARFYKAGWHALKAGTGNMDLLVAIGTTAGWGLSMWMWLAQGSSHLYFGFGRGGDAGADGQVAGGAAKLQTTAAIRALQALRPRSRT